MQTNRRIHIVRVVHGPFDQQVSNHDQIDRQKTMAHIHHRDIVMQVYSSSELETVSIIEKRLV